METESDKVLGKKPKTIMRRRGKRQDDRELETEETVFTAEIRDGESAWKETLRRPGPPELRGGQFRTCSESRASLCSGVDAQALAPRHGPRSGEAEMTGLEVWLELSSRLSEESSLIPES